ncbi:Uma2 family endonuclease [Thiohalocapsa sp. ML1]|uniref:Uma2 family endonuclease n=1 Tax=Thiohalocapsa sp. ML1 TaxID=1431688 RepID=UPI000731EEC7|nr:Uma2 family endonuclease [Thiohalocapsa sp. ML1]
MSPTALRDAPAARHKPRTSAPLAATSAPSADGLRVGERDYWTDFYLAGDRSYEWNHGRLEEKPVSDCETWLVYLWLLELVRHYLRAQPIAQVVGLEMGFRLALPSGTVIRRPDFGIVRDDNPEPLLPLDVSYHGIFDLCVEALSDKDSQSVDRDLVLKRAEYAAAGVPEYFIVHREPARQAFFRLDDGGLYVPIAPADGLIRSSVLPGWQFRVTDLITRPGPEAMSRDPVYWDFVLPGWRHLEREARDAAARAEAEAARAETEAARAESADKRADAEAAARAAAEQELAALRAQLASR